jgi:hypothetical protein
MKPVHRIIAAAARRAEATELTMPMMFLMVASSSREWWAILGSNPPLSEAL